MERAGAVFAPIPSLRSCAAYRPAALRRRNRQAACAKKAMDQAHAWGSPGHCDRIRALEKLEIVSYCVSRWGPSRSRLKVPKPKTMGLEPQASDSDTPLAGPGSGSLAGSRHRDGYPTGSVSDSRA